MKEQWSRTCRVIKHLIDLYKASLEKKDKNVETNLICLTYKNDDDINMTYLDVEDYLVNPDDGENYFISNSSK